MTEERYWFIVQSIGAVAQSTNVAVLHAAVALRNEGQIAVRAYAIAVNRGIIMS